MHLSAFNIMYLPWACNGFQRDQLSFKLASPIGSAHFLRLYIVLLQSHGGQRVECGDKDSNDSLRPMFEYVVPHRWHYLGKIRRYGAVEEGMSL
ncbi:hypothetical protein ACQP3J_27920, partial [Escherichia coli]